MSTRQYISVLRFHREHSQRNGNEERGTGNFISLVNEPFRIRRLSYGDASLGRNCTMTSLQVFRYGYLLRCNTKTRTVLEASCRPQILDLNRLNANRFLHCQSNCMAGVSGRGGAVARIGQPDVPVNRDEISGASLVMSLMAAILTSCPPALSADFEILNSANAKCSLTGVQANGYEYAYPESWIRDRIRGIEVLAHDPEVAELNMSIFTSPAQSGTLSGSAAEVGQAIITQYQKSPTIDKAELLGVDMKQDGSSNRSYSIELFVKASGKQRHFLTKLIRTDRKVLSLTLQVPEELWLSSASCMKSIIQNFKQTTII